MTKARCVVVGVCCCSSRFFSLVTLPVVPLLVYKWSRPLNAFLFSWCGSSAPHLPRVMSSQVRNHQCLEPSLAVFQDERGEGLRFLVKEKIDASLTRRIIVHSRPSWESTMSLVESGAILSLPPCNTYTEIRLGADSTSTLDHP